MKQRATHGCHCDLLASVAQLGRHLRRRELELLAHERPRLTGEIPHELSEAAVVRWNSHSRFSVLEFPPYCGVFETRSPDGRPLTFGSSRRGLWNAFDSPCAP